jgi:hypothetical protein
MMRWLSLVIILQVLGVMIIASECCRCYWEPGEASRVLLAVLALLC